MSVWWIGRVHNSVPPQYPQQPCNSMISIHTLTFDILLLRPNGVNKNLASVKGSQGSDFRTWSGIGTSLDPVWDAQPPPLPAHPGQLKHPPAGPLTLGGKARVKSQALGQLSRLPGSSQVLFQATDPELCRLRSQQHTAHRSIHKAQWHHLLSCVWASCLSLWVRTTDPIHLSDIHVSWVPQIGDIECLKMTATCSAGEKEI